MVSPAGGHAFHNRLTHALKVAQVGRRIAEKLDVKENKETIKNLGGLDPVVVEAASLAHDLGHPPFGHIAEEELHHLVYKAGDEDGFEGNAQSFRIVTALESRESGRGGLDLSRATLNGLLKYPCMRNRTGEEPVKIGAYETEKKEFQFAREYTVGDKPSLEAQIMDWADDITYAVHDLEDFYRVGKIPLNQLARSPADVDKFLSDRFKSNEATFEHIQLIGHALFYFCPVSEEYTGTRTQRAALRGFASSIIHEAVTGTTLSEEGLIRPPTSALGVDILKALTWHYVIDDPELATEQHGKRKVIRDLFQVFMDAAMNPKRWKLFPGAYREQLEDKSVSVARTTADFVSSLGEQRAVELYAELSGTSLRPLITGLAL